MMKSVLLTCNNIYNIHYLSYFALRIQHNLKRNLSSLMKAVCIHEFGPPSVLKVEEIEKPTPQNSEVLVKVYAAGVNPVDTYIREGEYANIPKLPVVLGKEVAGVVEAVGAEVNKFKVGDRVTCCMPWNGGYAEYVCCNEKLTISLPDKLTFSQGATLYVAYFSALRALLTKCMAKRGETLLVHGASGAVGVAAVQWALSQGLYVTGTAGTEEGMELVRSLGVKNVFNHWKKGYALEAYASTGGKGFDIILESCAHINLGTDLKLLKNNGRIAVIGSRGSVEVNPRYMINTEAQIHGIKLFAVTEQEFRYYVQLILEGVENGSIYPVIAQEFNITQVVTSHIQLMNETGARGKLVLKIL